MHLCSVLPSVVVFCVVCSVLIASNNYIITIKAIKLQAGEGNLVTYFSFITLNGNSTQFLQKEGTGQTKQAQNFEQ